MKRFFVLNEHTLCAVSDKPTFGAFLQGPLTFSPTVLAVQEKSPYTVGEVIPSVGYPLMRLANQQDFKNYGLDGFHVAELVAQDKETELSADELTTMAPAVRTDFSSLMERYKAGREKSISLLQLVEQAAIEFEQQQRIVEARGSDATITMVQPVFADYFTEAQESLCRLVKEAITAIMTTPLEKGMPELEHSLEIEVKVNQETRISDIPDDPAQEAVYYLLNAYGAILEAHKLMVSTHQRHTEIISLRDTQNDLFAMLHQQYYNHEVINMLLVGKGQHHNEASSDKFPVTDWLHLESDRNLINELVYISEEMISRYTENLGEYQEYINTLSSLDSYIPRSD